METIYMRLLEVARDQGFSDPIPNTALQSILGISSGRVAQIRKDPSSRIGAEAAAKLAKLGYNIDWVNEGRLPKLLLSSSGRKVLELAYSSPDETIRINKFDAGGSMGCGVVLKDQPGIIQSWNVSPEWLNKNVRQHTGAHNLVVVTGFGDSMKPMFNPGDPLLVDIGVTSVDLDAIYFFRVEGEGFIKRLQRIPGEGIRVISENKAYESWTIRKDMDFQVFGRVLKVWCSEEF